MPIRIVEAIHWEHGDCTLILILGISYAPAMMMGANDDMVASQIFGGVRGRFGGPGVAPRSPGTGLGHSLAQPNTARPREAAGRRGQKWISLPLAQHLRCGLGAVLCSSDDQTPGRRGSARLASLDIRAVAANLRRSGQARLWPGDHRCDRHRVRSALCRRVRAAKSASL